MTGYVDVQLRALISIRVAPTLEDTPREVLAWIDTAFNGSLVIPRTIASKLQLVKESSAEAILADGNKVELETYACVIQWFEGNYETQIVTNDSEYGLIGTMLLDGHRLRIDYNEKVVTLE